MLINLSEMLRDRVESLQPRSLLVLGEQAARLFDCSQIVVTGCTVDVLDVGDVIPPLEELGMYDFAFVAGLLERLDKARANTIIARLRDVHSRRLMVVIPIGAEWKGHQSCWEASDLLSLGMTLRMNYEQDGKPLHVYEFDITRYKATPE